MPYLYPIGGRREVNDSEVNELFQRLRELNNIGQLDDKLLMEEHDNTTGLFRKTTVTFYQLWLNIYGGEYEPVCPQNHTHGYVPKEIMVAFLSGVLQGSTPVTSWR